MLGCWAPGEEGLCEPEGLSHDSFCKGKVGVRGAGGGSKVPKGKFKTIIAFPQNVPPLKVQCEVSPAKRGLCFKKKVGGLLLN